MMPSFILGMAARHPGPDNDAASLRADLLTDAPSESAALRERRKSQTSETRARRLTAAVLRHGVADVEKTPQSTNETGRGRQGDTISSSTISMVRGVGSGMIDENIADDADAAASAIRHPPLSDRITSNGQLNIPEHIVFDKNLTKSDVLVLQSLVADINEQLADRGRPISESKDGPTLQNRSLSPQNGLRRRRNSTAAASNEAIDGASSVDLKAGQSSDEATIEALTALNDPADARFEPTVFTSVDLDKSRVPKWIMQPYVRIARSIVRVEADVVMLTSLLVYFTTSVPSAAFLFWRFSWIHGLLHLVMQVLYMGPYTLMMHQHIHGRGVLNKRLFLIDEVFPYILGPLMGHTWNSYYYHHVKHHHIEGNGPEDLSSTVRYQRDSLLHLLHYIGRFFLLIWLELPLYFFKKGRLSLALKAFFWEWASYSLLYYLCRVNPQPAICAVLLPFLLLRIALMVGNWGQHAFVDDLEPDSDYRSSITLIDVASNRYSFNDGYHTSHHLNPRRHWREHPAAFMKGKEVYASQHALVFHNIDYIMLTVRLMMKDYETLAKCMVPMGEQVSLTLEERVALLKRHTRRFTEEEIRTKFR